MEQTKYPTTLENVFRSLIGSPVLQVEYKGREYHLQHPASNDKTEQAGIHMVDAAVRFYTSSHTALEIYWNTIKTYWDEEFLNYGIKARFVEAQANAGEHTWNVSGEALWQDVIGQTITDVNVYSVKTWVESPKTGVQMDFSYPKTIALTFSNSKVVYISTAEYSAGHRYHVVRGVSGLVVATKQTTVEQHTCSEGNK